VVTLNFHRNATRRALCALRVALVLLVLGVASATVQNTSTVAAQAAPTATNADTCSELALAPALVDALNSGDEGGTVALFDPEATLTADRYAWTHFEIRLWATSRRTTAPRPICQPQSCLDAVAAGRLSVPVHRSYTLDELATAHADMETGPTTGKLVVLL
jgi:NADPH:quinone reductase